MNYIKTITKIIAGIAGLAFIGGIAYFILSKDIRSIVRTKDIPTLPLAGLGKAGTLYCKGKIIETTAGVEYIQFDWAANVTFPGDNCKGRISFPVFDQTQHPEWTDVLDILTPTGEDEWLYGKGEYHLWEMVAKFFENDIYFQFSDNGNIFAEFWFSEYSGINVGWQDFREGNISIYTMFLAAYNVADPYEINIQTDPFILVKQGSNFWFE